MTRRSWWWWTLHPWGRGDPLMGVSMCRRTTQKMGKPMRWVKSIIFEQQVCCVQDSMLRERAMKVVCTRVCLAVWVTSRCQWRWVIKGTRSREWIYLYEAEQCKTEAWLEGLGGERPVWFIVHLRWREIWGLLSLSELMNAEWVRAWEANIPSVFPRCFPERVV